MKQRLLFLIILISVALMTVACGSDDEDEAPPEDLNALINNAATELDNASSFQFELRQSGAPTYFFIAGFEEYEIIFENAVATFVADNIIQANLNVDFNGSTVKAEIIAAGANQYLRLAEVTGNNYWQDEYVADFVPADLLSDEKGIGSALRSMQNVEFIGNEEILSLPVYHLRGTVAAERIRSVTVGLMSTETGDIVTDIYIRRDGTNRLAYIELQEPSPAGAEEDLSKTWEIEFRGYNQPYTIVEPSS